MAVAAPTPVAPKAATRKPGAPHKKAGTGPKKAPSDRKKKHIPLVAGVTVPQVTEVGAHNLFGQIPARETPHGMCANEKVTLGKTGGEVNTWRDRSIRAGPTRSPRRSGTRMRPCHSSRRRLGSTKRHSSSTRIKTSSRRRRQWSPSRGQPSTTKG